MPLEQFRRTHGIGLVIRLRGDPALEAESVRQALQRVMPGSAYLVTQPLLGPLYRQRHRAERAVVEVAHRRVEAEQEPGAGHRVGRFDRLHT